LLLFQKKKSKNPHFQCDKISRLARNEKIDKFLGKFLVKLNWRVFYHEKPKEKEKNISLVKY